MAADETITSSAPDDAKRKNLPKRKFKLTDRGLQALKPAEPGGRYTVWDTEAAGFGVRVTDRGVRTFIVMRRQTGYRNPVRVALGRYPDDLSLGEARDLAGDAKKLLKSGVHPREQEERRRREMARERKDTFESIAEAFITRHVAGLRTKRDAENTIRRDLVPPWRGRPITSITKHDVVEVIEDIISRRGTPGSVCYAAHHSLAYAKKLFAWASARNYGLENNPCDKIKPGELIGAKAKRKRVLTDDEIRLLWKVTGDIAYPLAPLGPLVRMLLVTGQRLREIAHGEWRELDLGDAVWTIPGSRMKNGDAHEVPLPPLALDILKSLTRFQSGMFVFSSTGGRRPVSGFSKYKLRLDKAMLRAHRRALGVPEDDGDLRRALGLADGGTIPRDHYVDPFTFHDLRRSMRTRLSALPIPDEVRELMIAHRPSGLHQTYDLHRYRDEKRRGFELWAERLLRIVNASDSTVVPLRKAR
jgi:integrase